MSVRDPSQMPATFGRLFNARDKAGLLALYEPAALLTIDGATVAQGLDKIGHLVQPLLDSPLQITIRCGTCHVAGELALVRSVWSLADGAGTVAMTGASAEVLRRGTDGSWRFVLDDASYASRAVA